MDLKHNSCQGQAGNLEILLMYFKDLHVVLFVALPVPGHESGRLSF